MCIAPHGRNFRGGAAALRWLPQPPHCHGINGVHRTWSLPELFSSGINFSFSFLYYCELIIFIFYIVLVQPKFKFLHSFHVIILVFILYRFLLVLNFSITECYV